MVKSKSLIFWVSTSVLYIIKPNFVVQIRDIILTPLLEFMKALILSF